MCGRVGVCVWVYGGGGGGVFVGVGRVRAGGPSVCVGVRACPLPSPTHPPTPTHCTRPPAALTHPPTPPHSHAQTIPSGVVVRYITGQGHHSDGGVARIRPAVLALLAEHRVPHVEGRGWVEATIAPPRDLSPPFSTPFQL